MSQMQHVSENLQVFFHLKQTRGLQETESQDGLLYI